MDGTVFAFDPDWVSTLNAPFMTVSYTHLDVYKRQPILVDIDFGSDDPVSNRPVY